MDPLPGVRGVSKGVPDPLNTPFEVWCANIAPKLKNIQNTLIKQGFFYIFFTAKRKLERRQF